VFTELLPRDFLLSYCLIKLKTSVDCSSRVRGLGEHIDYRNVPESLVDLREVLRTTMQIRRAALDAVGDQPADTSFREYLFALTARMLRYASGIADEASSNENAEDKAVRTWHALYAAAKAAQQAIDLEDSQAKAASVKG
jgi:hypothetical protein